MDLEELKGFKQIIDEGSVSEVNLKEIRPFLQLEHFSPEVIEKRTVRQPGFVLVINIVNYYDIVLQVEPKWPCERPMRSSRRQRSIAGEAEAALQERLDVLTVESMQRKPNVKKLGQWLIRVS